MNNSTWKSDPRLHAMDASKIALLASFADELASTPENERMRAFSQPESEAAERVHLLFGRRKRTSL